MKKLKKSLSKKSKKKTKLSKKNKKSEDIDKKTHKSKIPEKLRRIVIDDIQRFLDILGLNNYEITAFYQSNTPDIATSQQMQDRSPIASIDIDDRYLKAEIYIYPLLIEQWNKKIIKEKTIHSTIAHEISHIVTNQLFTVAKSNFKTEKELVNSWESLTTVVGRLVNNIDELKKSLDK